MVVRMVRMGDLRAMTIRCPKCKTPSLLSTSEVGEVGRLERCPNCKTTWLARHFAENATISGAGIAGR